MHDKHKFLRYVSTCDWLFGTKLIFFSLNNRSLTPQLESAYQAFEFPCQPCGSLSRFVFIGQEKATSMAWRTHILPLSHLSISLHWFCKWTYNLRRNLGLASGKIVANTSSPLFPLLTNLLSLKLFYMQNLVLSMPVH